MPYLTPDSIPAAAICRRLRIPNDTLIIAAVNGAITELAKQYNWQQFGAITPEEMASAMIEMFDDYEKTAVSCMIGGILYWPNRVIPDNCLLCDGAAYDRVDYPDLYAALDVEFIVDADTFLVPDLEMRIPLSPADLDTINDSGGNASITIATSQLPSHSHSIGGAGTGLAVAPGELPVLTPSLIPTSTGDTGSGDSVNIQNPYRKIPCVIIAK